MHVPPQQVLPKECAFEAMFIVHRQHGSVHA